MALAASRQQASSRPRLLQAVFDAVQQPDIRKKLLFTAAMLVVFRFVAHIPIPGVDPRQLEDAFNSSALLGFFNLFSGGALRRVSIAALGVYPYITANIIMQLVTPIFPSLVEPPEGGRGGPAPARAVPALGDGAALLRAGLRAARHPAPRPSASTAPGAMFDPSFTGDRTRS